MDRVLAGTVESSAGCPFRSRCICGARNMETISRPPLSKQQGSASAVPEGQAKALTRLGKPQEHNASSPILVRLRASPLRHNATPLWESLVQCPVARLALRPAVISRCWPLSATIVASIHRMPACNPAHLQRLLKVKRRYSLGSPQAQIPRMD